MELRPDEQPESPGADVAFGPFRLLPGKRLLTRDGVPLEIGGRALDILIALVAQPGRVVTKRELLARVWSGVVVEEGSLRFHMTSLRKILGDGEDGARYIATQVGVGYAFVAPIERTAPAPAAAPAQPPVGAGNLPPRTRLIGREADIDLVVGRLAEPRLFTLVGAGGVGKTSLAVERGIGSRARTSASISSTWPRWRIRPWCPRRWRAPWACRCRPTIRCSCCWRICARASCC